MRGVARLVVLVLLAVAAASPAEGARRTPPTSKVRRPPRAKRPPVRARRPVRTAAALSDLAIARAGRTSSWCDASMRSLLSSPSSGM